MESGCGVIEVISLSFAFVFGMLVRQVGLPPLVGFLLAGFALNLWGPGLGLPETAGPVLDHVAHLGVLLLLFTVGLKLRLRQLLEIQVLGAALAHFLVTTGVFSAGLYVFLSLAPEQAILLGIALSFSSTVLAAKVLDAKRELRVFHGRLAIGILIIQDLIALVVLSVAGDHAPSIWALAVFALPLLRPVMYWLLDVAGHDELLVLMGVVLAVAFGGAGFEVVGLSAEVGALVMGVLLSSHPRAQELSDSLWGLKEIFLVGFFLQIGMEGLPDLPALGFALVMAAILPLKGLLFVGLLVALRIRARNALLAGLSLTSYSEFGLIVAAGVLEAWLVPLALTVAISFLIAAPLNRFAHPLYDRLEKQLARLERTSSHPDEQPANFARVDMLVFGMGRTGTAAYQALSDRGLAVAGLDADPGKVDRHRGEGRHVVYADAEDASFWHSVDLTGIRAAILTMPDLEGKLIAARELRKRGFGGPIIANSMYEDESARIREAGADETYLTMTGAGIALADYTCDALGEERREKPA